MQFDTLIYAVFLPAVFLVYWAMHKLHHRYQNMWLLAASYLFYGWWDWRFLSLIAATTVVTYGLALATQRFTSHRKAITATSVTFNLLILVTFKYLNFFIESTRQLCNSIGFDLDYVTINLVLPIGISFYTFQAISYAIDVYRGDVKPTKQLHVFAVYIAFFPQLVAGPIEKSRNLMPQFAAPRQFNYAQAVLGMRQILWGLAKKIVIADQLSGYVSNMLYNPYSQSATTLILACIFFAIQIYVDFSAYSDIAIGSAKLFGIRLSTNFRYPYFSRNMRELWQRWHISLMEWLRDYVYIPLGGSRCSKLRTCINIMLVFLLSGLWHGANFTYVLWGAMNGMLVTICYLCNCKRNTSPATLSQLPSIVFTFLLAALCFMPFRCYNLTHYHEILQCIACGSFAAIPQGLSAFAFLLPFFVIEWIGRKHEFPLHTLPRSTAARWAIYWTLLALIAYYCSGEVIQYIYFQF
ncbi:MAG: MBOAT family O-acyltransferase [Muribaculaceae bacterium]